MAGCVLHDLYLGSFSHVYFLKIGLSHYTGVVGLNSRKYYFLNLIHMRCVVYVDDEAIHGLCQN